MKKEASNSIFVLVVVICLLVGCGQNNAYVTGPPRPAGLPEDAVWRGGPEGGDWISCELENTGLSCSGYGAATVSLMFRQRYKLCAAENNLSELVGYLPFLDEPVDVLEGKIQLVQIGPPEIFSNGEKDVELTDKAAAEFGQLEPICYHEILIAERSKVVPKTKSH